MIASALESFPGTLYDRDGMRLPVVRAGNKAGLAARDEAVGTFVRDVPFLLLDSDAKSA